MKQEHHLSSRAACRRGRDDGKVVIPGEANRVQAPSIGPAYSAIAKPYTPRQRSDMVRSV